MTYKYGNWYCEPSTKEEAREIVERAKASGAKSRSEWAFTARFYGVYKGEVKPYSMGTKYTIDEVRQKFPLPVDKISTSGDGIGAVGTLKTPLSGLYRTASCEDAPIETPAVLLVCDFHTSRQVAVCADGSWYVRKTDFKSYWDEWKPMQHHLQVQVPQEWNGEGMPPVGTVCEHWWGGVYDDDVEIVQYRRNGNHVVFWRINKDCVDGAEIPTAEFRPLRTERERWVENALNILQKDPASMPAQLMGMIYDSLKSGDLKAPEIE